MRERFQMPTDVKNVIKILRHFLHKLRKRFSPQNILSLFTHLKSVLLFLTETRTKTIKNHVNFDLKFFFFFLNVALGTLLKISKILSITSIKTDFFLKHRYNEKILLFFF